MEGERERERERERENKYLEEKADTEFTGVAGWSLIYSGWGARYGPAIYGGMTTVKKDTKKKPKPQIICVGVQPPEMDMFSIQHQK